jgi:eukaryotic-like serine/threonine-protein kinase
MKTRILFSFALLLVLATLACWRWARPAPLGEADFLLLGEVANHTGNADFDDSLREALRVSLLQSPYLNLVSDEKTRATLTALGKPGDSPLAPELSQEICERAGAKAYLTGEATKAGSHYAFDLLVRRCLGGDRLAHVAGEAERADLVIHQLGVAASELRARLGEQEATLKKYDMPLERATTPIPAALKRYEQARRAIREKGDFEAVPLYKQSIDLDSRFAMARSGLAVSYYNLSQMALAGDEIRLAFEAGDRQTVRERLNIQTLYYDLAQGDIEKAVAGYQEYIRIYPRDSIALGNLSSEFFVIGDYEQAAQYAEQALKLDPDSSAWYENDSIALLALGRTQDAERVLQEAFSRKLDDAALHSNLYSVAFVKGDTGLMQAQLAWADGKPGQDSLLGAQADTEAYFGHLQKAREYTKRAIDVAMASDLKESAAIWAATAAIRESMFDNSAEAQKYADEALKLTPDSKDVRALVALVHARSGNEARAQSTTDDLRALYVSNTAMQKAWLPVIRAQIAMRKRQNAEAIQQLEIVLPYEKGQLTGNSSDSCMIPTYLRGEAELALQKGHQAAMEFQKIEANPGVIGNCWSGALARLGKARAEVAAQSSTDAKISYQQFLTLWKDADSDIPLLKQARLEAAKLH